MEGLEMADEATSLAISSRAFDAATGEFILSEEQVAALIRSAIHTGEA
jgi:hypothetical protein